MYSGAVLCCDDYGIKLLIILRLMGDCDDLDRLGLILFSGVAFTSVLTQGCAQAEMMFVVVAGMDGDRVS